ncbi:hypothetical protein ACF0H5_007469 [Mactra antiquata]
MQSLRNTFRKISIAMVILILLNAGYSHQSTTHSISSTISTSTLLSVDMTSDHTTEYSSTAEAFVSNVTSSQEATTETPSEFILDCDNSTGSNMLYNETIRINCTGSDVNATTIQPEVHYVRLEDFTEYQVYLFVNNYFVYFTTLPGFITNPLCIIVSLHVKPFRTSELYMLTLGITDWVHVIARFTLRQLTYFNVEQTNFVCKLIMFVANFSLVYSNFVVMAWTIERFIAVIVPLKLSSWCTMRNTSALLIVLCIIDVALSTTYIFETKKGAYTDGVEEIHFCYYSQFYFDYWAHIESVYYIYIPMLVVCSCNLVILLRVRAMTKARIQMAGNQDIVDKRTKEQRQMTILLVTVSAGFVILHIPMVLVVIFGYLYNYIELFYTNKLHYVQFIMLVTIGYSITEFQNSINFFLYCITGTKFRNAFLRIICCCRAKPQMVVSSMTHTTGMKSMSESSAG